jgi:hypothetical protein
MIFAQNEDFTRGEVATVNNAIPNSYELQVGDTSYSLLQDGSEILAGPLREYIFNPSLSSPPLPFNPYQTPGFLFFGDNTGQEAGVFRLYNASITAAAEPVPAPIGVLGVAVATGWARRLRRRLGARP